MASFLKNVGAFVAAVLVTYALAAIFATSSVMSRLADMGVSVSFADRLATHGEDLVGMFALFAPLLGIALLLGFLVAGIIVRWQPTWRSFGYPLAGFAAVVVMHLLLKAALDITPVAAARTAGGVLMQGVAGALGGWAFYRLGAGRAVQQAAQS